MLTKKNIFSILAFALIITALVPLVAKNMPSPLGSFRWLYGPIWLMALIFFKPKVYTQKPVLVLLIYALISIIVLENTVWIYMSEWYKKSIFEEFYALIVMVTLMSYFITTKDYKGWAIIGKWALIFIVITGIMTIFATSIIPTIARLSATGFKALPIMKVFFDRTGCGGYGFGQSLTLIFPVLIYYIKLNKQIIFPRRVLITITIFLFFVVIRIQAFANLIIAAMVITISLLGTKHIKKSITIILIVTVLALSIPVRFYADVLVSVSHFFDVGSENYFKLNDMASFILNPDVNTTTGAGSRTARYPMLLAAFLQNPLLGDASYNRAISEDISAGGHLFWMSRLTLWGIGGFIFYAFMLLTIFKKVISLFNKQFTFYYTLSISAFIVLGLLKTIAGRENIMMLFVIIPGLYYLPLIKKTKNNYLFFK